MTRKFFNQFFETGKIAGGVAFTRNDREFAGISVVGDEVRFCAADVSSD
jgi:hypothetical protein